MRRPILILSLYTLTFGCGSSSEPRQTSNEAAPATSGGAPAEPAPVPYEIAAVYTKDNQQWQAVVVDDAGDLEALAKELHAKLPEVRFHVFDDGTQVDAYVSWTKNYPSDEHPYPEEWLKGHHLGMINRMLTGEGPKWTLQGGDAHPTQPGATILQLD